MDGMEESMNMGAEETLDLGRFRFRGLHPLVYMGTASDRYASWIGQIYSEARFGGKVKKRSHKVGGKSFEERTVPVESVEEYFEHFRVVELDFTFYRPLLDGDGRPTPNLHVLHQYMEHAKGKALFILKVPQMVFARKIMRKGKFVENETYLNADVFEKQFFAPATELLGTHLAGFIFEQEYQRKQEKEAPKDLAAALDGFMSRIPQDKRYHVELRTPAYLCGPVFDVLENHGVGQVLSHWTWLPPLKRQLALAGNRFFNAGGDVIIRLLTPRGVRYEKAYAQAHPFGAMVEGMLNPQMVNDTADIMHAALRENVRVHVISNNRAGGNAPLIAVQVAERFQAAVPKNDENA